MDTQAILCYIACRAMSGVNFPDFSNHTQGNPMLLRTFLAVCVLSFPLALPATEYFVALNGDDENSGLSREQAFATIQRGVDALLPGDILTILPGEYRESVFRDGLGNAEVDTIIRAERPGTAILRGDVPVSGFRRVPGYERVYVTEWDGPVEAVSEIDTRRQMRTQVAADELEVSPGGYCHDSENGLLYVSTTDMAPPEQHMLTVAVNPDHGLFLDNPVRVIIDGLVARGFNSRNQASWTPGAHCYWGIILRSSTNCIIRNCIAYANGGGIAGRTQDGHDNVIENCIAYGNFSVHSAEGGNIIFFSPRRDTIRNCLSFKSGENGIRLYGSVLDLKEDEGSLIDGCISWGSRYADIFVKGGGTAKYSHTRNSVARAIGHAANIQNVFIGTINQYCSYDNAPRDSVYQRDEKLDEEKEFADPYNFDFRLQSDSSLRGSAADGGDRGPAPYTGNVYFLTPGGNDSAAGTSVNQAWSTLSHALKNVGPGDTLYILDGTFPAPNLANLGGDPQNPLYVRARGTGTVVFSGSTSLQNATGVSFERIQFERGVKLDNCRDVGFDNCRIYNSATGLAISNCEDIRIEHCQLTDLRDSAIACDNSTGLILFNNVFDNRTSPALRIVSGDPTLTLAYSDYNGFTSEDLIVALPDGSQLALSDRQAPGMDLYSIVVETDFAMKDGIPQPTAPQTLIGRSAHGNSLGIHIESRDTPMTMTAPAVTSVSATTANIEWVTNGHAYFDVAWGTTPECENNTTAFNPYDNKDTLYSFSLTGLQPNTTYYFRIKRAYLPNSLLERGQRAPVVPEPKFDVISFTTAASDPDPVTYYVSANGDDSADGLSPETAWRTIRCAGMRARPGDTVIIGGGNYFERVRMRVTGAPNRPITFRVADGEIAVLDGMQRQLDRAILASSKNHLRIDGLDITGYALTYWHTGALSFVQCDDIQITRCIYDGRGAGYPSAFLNAYSCGDLLIADCVIASGIFGIGIRNQHGELVVENNVFLRNMIEGTKIGISKTGSAYVRNNIFTDSMPDKVGVNYHEWDGYDRITEDNNLYVIRIPDQDRRVFGIGDYRGPKNTNSRERSGWRGGVADYNEQIEPTTSMAVLDAKFASLQSEEMQESLRQMIENRRVQSRVHYGPDLFISRERFPRLTPDIFESIDPTIQSRGFGPRYRTNNQ